MSTGRSVIASGSIALLLAVSIFAVASLGGLGSLGPVNNNGPGPASTSSGGVTTTPSGQSTQSTSSLQGGSPSTLSILLTDPPHVPQGVTKVYVSYTGLSVHHADSSQGSGWVVLKSSGQVELLGTVNVGLTLASAGLPAGKYDAVSLNVSSATVTFRGTNYTAFVEKAQITAPIVGGVEVTSGGSTAVLVSITPTVFNIGSNSTPEFVIRAGARAFQVPGTDVSRDTEHEGFKLNLAGKWWWNFDQDAYSVNLQISNVKLSANGLSLTVKNTGQGPAMVKLVVVSPAGGNNSSGSDRTPEMFADSAVFLVYPNQTLLPIHMGKVAPGVASGENGPPPSALPIAGGFNLTAGASVTLSYSGPMYLGYGVGVPTQQISSGESYMVTVIGDEATAAIEATVS